MRARIFFGGLVGVAIGCAPAPPARRASPLPVVLTTPPAEAGAPVVEVPAPPPQPLPAAKPEAPPVAPIDPNIEVSTLSFLARNDKQALMLASGSGDANPYYVVIDLATSCAVESYRQGDVFRAMRQATSPLVMETYYGKETPPGAAPLDPALLSMLNDAKGTAEIRSVVGLANRFGLTSVQYAPLAWSAEGPHVFVTAGLLYHSTDGGRTFHPVDDYPSANASISPDGKTVVYERCGDHEAIPGRPVCRAHRELVAAPLDAMNAKVSLALLSNVDGYVFHEGFSQDGHALVWRTDATRGCLHYVDPKTAAVDRKVCIADPHFARRSNGRPTNAPQLVKWLGLSPDEGTGAIEWESFRQQSLTYETVILDMKAGVIGRTLPDFQFRFLGDGGTVVVQSWSSGSDPKLISAPGKPMRLVDRGAWVDWDSKTGRAIVDLYPRGKKIGKNACKLVAVRSVP